MKFRALIAALFVLIAALLAPVAAQAAFGVKDFEMAFENEDGSVATQAGEHPFQVTTTFDVNTKLSEGGQVLPDGDGRSIRFTLPPGFIGATNAVPRCTMADFATVDEEGYPACPDDTAVGAATVQAVNFGGAIGAPVYNLVPPPGVPVKLGFVFIPKIPITIEVGVSPEPPYEVVATAQNIVQAAPFYGASMQLWGVPAAHVHDPFRGKCLEQASVARYGELISKGSCEGGKSVPFLTLPRSCAGPLSAGFEVGSWQQPDAPPVAASSTISGMLGCGKLGFGPTIAAKPTTEAAQSPTGLSFNLDVHDEGLTNPVGLAQSDIRKAVVTLPEGFTTNPSLAEGLDVCTEADLSRETVNSAPGEGCPEASKIGTVEVETPLLEESVEGSIFAAKPYENEVGSLLALYMVIKNPNLGVIVKQALKVEGNPVTGQITTVADNLPQLPFSHFKLHFREGVKSPLASPPLCGTYDTSAVLFPWSGGQPVETTSAFQIIVGPESGPCPSGGTPPFNPGLTAGTLNNAAGSYSPFNIRLSRKDSEQEITHFSIKLPPGVTGKLAGVPFCSDAAIAAAKSRERTPHGGQEELERPSCPAASEIGHTLVGAGVGPSLTYVPGKVYLAGPYNGSNLSIVAITAAKAGPFDLGTVVIREGLKVSPVTAEVSVDAAGSDPIPHIIDGIPVHLRDIRVYVDRPEFVKNPTSCEPTSTASTVLGSGTDFASEADDRPVTVTSRFQAADCANLGFKPSLKISLKGPTKRAGLPALTAVVTPRAGDANIGRAVVTLPKSEFLEQGHIGNSCTRVQFNSGAGNGAGCPANSVLGHAVALTPLLDEPLEGAVYLRSNGGERKLPDLVAALHSKDIDIVLVGFISSLHKKGSDVSQIRTTFASVPDQPVTRFTLRMFGGKKGLLVNSTNLCKGTHKAISEFTGQNGKTYDTEQAVKAQCKKKGKKAKKKNKGHTKGKARVALAFRRPLAW